MGSCRASQGVTVSQPECYTPRAVPLGCDHQKLRAPWRRVYMALPLPPFPHMLTTFLS